MKFFIENGCWNILKVKSDTCKLNRSVKCNFLVLFKVRNDKKNTRCRHDLYLRHLPNILSSVGNLTKKLTKTQQNKLHNT